MRAAFKDLYVTVCKIGVTRTVYNTCTVCVGVNLFQRDGPYASIGQASHAFSFSSAAPASTADPARTL